MSVLILAESGSQHHGGKTASLRILKSCLFYANLGNCALCAKYAGGEWIAESENLAIFAEYVIMRKIYARVLMKKIGQ